MMQLRLEMAQTWRMSGQDGGLAKKMFVCMFLNKRRAHLVKLDVHYNRGTTSISLFVGCDLFMRYVTRTSALEYEDFNAARLHLIERGEKFGEISLRLSLMDKCNHPQAKEAFGGGPVKEFVEARMQGGNRRQR